MKAMCLFGFLPSHHFVVVLMAHKIAVDVNINKALPWKG